jgi:hypothetical protein
LGKIFYGFVGGLYKRYIYEICQKPFKRKLPAREDETSYFGCNGMDCLEVKWYNSIIVRRRNCG